MSAPKLQTRRAGAYWRVLVHGLPAVRQKMHGPAHSVYSDASDVQRHEKNRARLGDYPTKDRETVTHLPDTEFDELVVGNWLHVEKMDTGSWWMNVGGVTLWVYADRDGKPKRVAVYGPDDYDSPRAGCKYECTWSGE